MKHHLNTLFITTQGAYLAKEGEAVTVSVERETRLRVPMHHLGGIVCLGRITVSPWLMAACANAGIAVSFLTEHGGYLASVRGFTQGNVLLRREQYRRADNLAESLKVACAVVAAKIANCRSVVRRAVRDYPDHDGLAALEGTSGQLARCQKRVPQAGSLDELRGIEGEAATWYFDVFNHLIVQPDGGFQMAGRSRRPPLDSVNAMLSFVYAMLAHDARAACEAAGLDSAVGFLHRDRPGRPSLALDLMEEFRPYLADRLVISLINRQQVTPAGFERTESGGVLMAEATRKTVIAAYQRRKQESVVHPFLEEQTTVGLLIHLQARLLARHLRGDLDGYPPFIAR